MKIVGEPDQQSEKNPLMNLIASGNNTKTKTLHTETSRETRDKSPGVNVSNIVGTDKHIYSLKELI
jgi:hypothetical protein